MRPFAPLARQLSERDVRYVLIGVSGANLHAHRAGLLFTTLDRDLFLPPEPSNLLSAWQACEALGLELTSSGQLLGRPRDPALAQRVVLQRASTSAYGEDLQVDLSLATAGFDFDEVWRERATFELDGVLVPVARLKHIVASKATAGREKDRLFLAAHAEALRQLLGSDES